MATSLEECHTARTTHRQRRPRKLRKPPTTDSYENNPGFGIIKADNPSTTFLPGKMSSQPPNSNVPTWTFTPATTSGQPTTSTPAHQPHYQTQYHQQYPPVSNPVPSSPQPLQSPPQYPAAFAPRPSGQRSRSGTSFSICFLYLSSILSM